MKKVIAIIHTRPGGHFTDAIFKYVLHLYFMTREKPFLEVLTSVEVKALSELLVAPFF